MRFRGAPKIKLDGKNKLVLALLLIVLVFFLINLAKSWQKNHQIDKEVGDLKNNIETTQKDNQQLKELIQYFNSTAYIEDKARTDLGLKKQGEKVVIVPNLGQDSNQNSANQADDQAKSKTNLQKWWQYFFN